jgi:hypothetical protein
MADKTTQSMNDILNYMLRGVTPSWGGGNTLYLSLHVGSIGAGGNQTTNEVDYTGYSRLPIVRTAGGDFTTANGGSTSNGTKFTFGQCTAEGTLPLPCNGTYVAIGESSSGTGTVIVYSALAGVGIVININSKPEFDISTLTVLEA